ncbi:chemotaxis response regulator protein-glutamate methylesterase [soil metagenome]
MASRAPVEPVKRSAPARVMVVDDSVVARAVITRMIDGNRRFAVAAAVPNADAALDFLRKERVDAIILDLEMPGIDGLTALPDLLAAGRGARVLIVSSSAGEGAAVTIQALALGAADTLVKPGAGSFAGRFAEVLEEKLTRLVFEAEDHGAATVPAPPENLIDGFDILAIGASTGGIHALSQMLRVLPRTMTQPILVTQHLPHSFMPYFAAQLSLISGRPCDVAQDRARIVPGRILIAPGDAHMRCISIGKGAAIRLTHEATVSGCTPSVDPMLESVAEVYGARGLAVILSGMGRDGLDGARKLAAVGGRIAVQDKETSVVWGMPGAVAEAGVANVILPPDEIGSWIAGQRRRAA